MTKGSMKGVVRSYLLKARPDLLHLPHHHQNHLHNAVAKGSFLPSIKSSSDQMNHITTTSSPHHCSTWIIIITTSTNVSYTSTTATAARDDQCR